MYRAQYWHFRHYPVLCEHRLRGLCSCLWTVVSVRKCGGTSPAANHSQLRPVCHSKMLFAAINTYLALLTFLPVLPFLIPSVHSMQCSVCSVSIAQICLNSRMAPPRPTGSIREADVRQSRLFGAVNGQTELLTVE